MLNTLKTFAQKFNNDWSMNLAGMLAYSLITTIFPILLAILTIAFIVVGSLSPGTFNQVTHSISTALPSQVQSVINVSAPLKNMVKVTGPLAIVSIVGLIWAGSNLFTNMENAFSIVFRTGNRGFIPQKIMAVGMVIMLAILLPVSVAASSFVTASSQQFHKALPPPLGLVLAVVGPLTAVAILWLLFLAIYIVVPNIKVPFRDAWRGAVAAAVLFGVFDVLFPLYFKFFLNGNAKYGATALAVLVVIVWLWFFALITLLGAQVNAVAMGIKPTRYDLARTLCNDYHSQIGGDATASSDQQPRGSKPGDQDTMRRPRKSEQPVSMALRLVALPFWLLARPAMRRRDQGRRRGAAV